MNLRQIRKTAFVMLILLLVCLVMVISVSYAWLSISRVPEVTGIDTNIGANGSLEIALLSDDTYTDPSLIRTKIGDSAVVKNLTTSNLAWGNVIDLKDASYGLKEITLVPSRLNVQQSREGQAFVASNMLMIPEYSFDGRFSKFMQDTVSAVYSGSDFIFDTDVQSYGVRGIGTISTLSDQQVAMAEARAAVRSGISSAESEMAHAWNGGWGEEFLNLFERKFDEDATPYSGGEVHEIQLMAYKMSYVLDHIDWALRYGLVGYGAAAISDSTTFWLFRNEVLDLDTPLSEIVEQLEMPLPAQYAEWIDLVAADREEMNSIADDVEELVALDVDKYAWYQIEPLWNRLLHMDHSYLGEDKLSSITKDDFVLTLSAGGVLTIGPEAGVMAHVADFIGNYNTFFWYWGENIDCDVEVTSTSVEMPPYLEQLNDQLYELRPSVTGRPMTEQESLDDVFGYVVDLAFRSNAGGDLLLQTESVSHVSVAGEQSGTQTGEQSGAQAGEQAGQEVPAGDTAQTLTQDAGSFMQFASDRLQKEQVLELMDAIRVGFVDNQYKLLGIAKLNTSNYEETEEGLKAPLYLYDYELLETGGIRMGERLKEENVIIELPRNIATVVSAVVWMDGDYVGNSSVDIMEKSMIGTLNLQFANSASLVPSEEPIENE